MKNHLDFSRGLSVMWQYRHEPETLRVLSTLYWLALLGVASLVMLGCLTFGFWTLINVLGADEMVVSGASLSTTPFTRTELQGALDAFRDREMRFEEQKGSAPAFADPFLSNAR